MRIFVSYARRDNSLERLAEIDSRLRAAGGSPYIDDMHHPAHIDRRRAVLAELVVADIFVAVRTTGYLRTEWTRLEFDTARRAGLPLAVLAGDSRLRRAAYGELLADATDGRLPGRAGEDAVMGAFPRGHRWRVRPR